MKPENCRKCASEEDLIPLCVSCHEYFHKGHKYNSATGVFDKIET